MQNIYVLPSAELVFVGDRWGSAELLMLPTFTRSSKVKVALAILFISFSQEYMGKSDVDWLNACVA